MLAGSHESRDGSFGRFDTKGGKLAVLVCSVPVLDQDALQLLPSTKDFLRAVEERPFKQCHFLQCSIPIFRELTIHAASLCLPATPRNVTRI